MAGEKQVVGYSVSEQSEAWIRELCAPWALCRSGVFAIRNHSSDRTWFREQLQAQAIPDVVLSPPLPWDLLAPLRHLCEQLHHPFSAWDDWNAEISSMSLGIHTILDRYFQRILESWPSSPVVAWIDADDLHQPMWGSWLQRIRHGTVGIPVSFVYMLPCDRAVETGIRVLSPSQADVQPRNSSNLGQPIPSRRLLQYWSQLLFFGPSVRRDAMQAVSRANHEKNIQALQRLGWITPDQRILGEKLRDVPSLSIPHGRSWRKKALSYLFRCGEVSSSRTCWLTLFPSPLMSGPASMKAESLNASLFFCDLELWYSTNASMSFSSLCPNIRWILGMVLPAQQQATWIEQTNIPPETWMDFLAQSSELSESQVVGILEFLCLGYHGTRESIDVLEQIYGLLLGKGPSWLAASWATVLSRWYLGMGRLVKVFALLGPYSGEAGKMPWVVQWQIHLSYVAAYQRMERFDLARHHLEKAVSLVPKPVGSLLQGELRLATARWLLATGQTEDAEIQLQEAKHAFLAAGDGVRLGRYFLLVGEHHWKLQQWEQARQVLGRSLDLFRRYRDGLGVQESQLKLGLVMRQAPIDVLGLSSG